MAKTTIICIFAASFESVMRTIHHIVIFVLCCFALCGKLSAQYEGKEFWFSCGTGHISSNWYDNLPSTDSIIIYILGQNACVGYIENPHSSYHLDFEVHPDEMTTLVLPLEEIAVEEQGVPVASVIQAGTICIRTDKNVRVWVQSPYLLENTETGDWDGMPWDVFGNFKSPIFPVEYYQTSYYLDNTLLFKYLLIATEDDTEVYLNGDTFFFNKGDFYVFSGGAVHTNCKKVVCVPYKGGRDYFGNFRTCALMGKDYLIRRPVKNVFYNKVANGTPSQIPVCYPFASYGTFGIVQTYHNQFQYNDIGSPDSVEYAFLRFQNGGKAILYFLYHVFSTIQFNSIPNQTWYSNNMMHPMDKMVNKWQFPITKNTYHLSSDYLDTTYVDLTIYVHADGVGSTLLNGQSVPATSFVEFPGTDGEYYSAQFAWNSSDSLPDYLTIENPNGFSAYLFEIGYKFHQYPYYYYTIWGPLPYVVYCYANYSGYELSDLYAYSNIAEHNLDTVHRCLGDTLALLVEHNPDSVPVEWVVDGVSHLGDGYSFLLTALDTLTVQCVLHYDCPDTTTTFVAVVPPPVLTIAHDTTVCAGATLSVEQPAALSYLWSNGATTPSITVDSAGTFQVSVTNIGCRAESDSFHVSLYGQSAVDFGNDSLLCELATLLLDATQQHPAQYLWQDGSTNTTYTVYQDGDYWVVITDHCLGASDTINIGYLNDFTVSLGPDTTLCEGRTMTLNAEVPYCDYLWQDGSTQPTYVVRGPGTYSVEVSNRCFSHWDAVNIEYEHCAQELYLPNAFTPDRDGRNEVFLPVFSYPDEIEEYRMEIYNRWGGLVFRTEEKTYGWDGANAINGVYAVVVRYKSRGEKEKTVKGSVTVVR